MLDTVESFPGGERRSAGAFHDPSRIASTPLAAAAAFEILRHDLRRLRRHRRTTVHYRNVDFALIKPSERPPWP